MANTLYIIGDTIDDKAPGQGRIIQRSFQADAMGLLTDWLKFLRALSR